MTERWRPIPDFLGYDVSDQGRVRSYWKQRGLGRPKGWAWSIANEPQRFLSLTLCGQYHQVVLRGNDRRLYTKRIHVLVAEVFIGPRPDGMNVLHNNDDRENNSVDNLRYGTQQENVHDSIQRRKAQGVSYTICKMLERMSTEELLSLSDTLKRLIKERYRQRYNQMVGPGASEPEEAE